MFNPLSYSQNCHFWSGPKFLVFRRMSHASSYKLVLAVSLFLLFAGLVLTAFSLFSAQWQVGIKLCLRLNKIWESCLNEMKFAFSRYMELPGGWDQRATCDPFAWIMERLHRTIQRTYSTLWEFSKTREMRLQVWSIGSGWRKIDKSLRLSFYLFQLMHQGSILDKLDNKSNSSRFLILVLFKIHPLLKMFIIYQISDQFIRTIQEELRKALDIGDEASHELLLHRFLRESL